MSLSIKMGFLRRGLKAKVMSTELIMEANVSRKILFEALDTVKRFEERFSAYNEDSLVSLINKNAGIEAVTCNQEECELFSEALKIAQRSKGKFDPTIGVLTQGLYGFGKTNKKIPAKQELQKTKHLVDYRQLHVEANKVFLAKKGMRLDLGGIGKGYIAQKVFLFLQSKGATKILVNAGGEILTQGKNYRVAITNPFDIQKYLGVIETKNTPFSISTSGDYERYIGSKKNHHILDNQTATQNHYYSSLTVLKNGITATLLDAVATIAFNTPADELKNLSKEYDVAIIAVTDEGELLFENFKNLDIKACEIFP